MIDLLKSLKSLVGVILALIRIDIDYGAVIMKRLSRVVLLFALALSGYSSASFASYFFFLKSGTQPNGTQIGAQVNLDDTGNGTLTIPAGALVPASGGALASPAMTFNISSSPLQSSRIFMWKEGTGGQEECLDMGTNATGLNVAPLKDTTDTYTLTLTVGDPANDEGCADQSNPPPPRSASITGGAVNWSGFYHLYNPLSQNSVPEPGTLMLLGLGLSGLLLAGRRKAKRT